MTELTDTLKRVKQKATGDNAPEPEVIRNRVHLAHRLADILYGDADEFETEFIVNGDDLNGVLNDIKSGRRIFKTPDITGNVGAHKPPDGGMSLADGSKPNLHGMGVKELYPAREVVGADKAGSKMRQLISKEKP